MLHAVGTGRRQFLQLVVRLVVLVIARVAEVQLHGVAVDDTVGVARFAVVGARVVADGTRDDQVAAVLEVALVGHVHREEVELAVDARFDFAFVPFVLGDRIAVCETFQGYDYVILHECVRAAEDCRVHVAEFDVFGLLDDGGTARDEAQFDC